MTTESRIAAFPSIGTGRGASNELAIGLGAAALAAQRLQLEVLLAWQQSIAAFQHELWDQWVCRWAGGAPIGA
jgi:hypothetical protein